MLNDFIHLFPPHFLLNFLFHAHSSALHFHFDTAIWEEHYIRGMTCLIVKMDKAPIGRYATLPLKQALEKGRTYILKARFKIKTESKRLNFHIKDCQITKSWYCLISAILAVRSTHCMIMIHTLIIIFSTATHFLFWRMQLLPKTELWLEQHGKMILQ